jgi:thiol-disulfide isomerase/thioredoxin
MPTAPTPARPQQQQRPRRDQHEQRGRERAAARERAARNRRITLVAVIGTGVLLVIIVVVAVLYTNANSTSAHPLTDPKTLNPAQQKLAVGTVAPDFDLATADGKHNHLASLRGHPVFLEFFAVWCPHCQRMAPLINRLETAYGPKGLQSLAILANPYGKDYDTTGDTRPADRSDIDWFTKTFFVSHPMLIDPNFATVNRYGASSYPTIYTIDSKGIIRYASAGEVSYDQLVSAVQAAGLS